MNRREMVVGSIVTLSTVPMSGCIPAIKQLAAKIAEIDYKFRMIYEMWESYKAIYIDVRARVIKHKEKLNLPPELWVKMEKLNSGLVEADKIIADIKIGKDIVEEEMKKVIKSANLMTEIVKGTIKVLPLIL